MIPTDHFIIFLFAIWQGINMIPCLVKLYRVDDLMAADMKTVTDAKGKSCR